MNGFGGAFDLDPFPGNGYGQSSSQGSPTLALQQQQQQQFGPCMDDYDPSSGHRTLLALNSYNPTGRGTQIVHTTTTTTTHHTLMPQNASVTGAPLHMQASGYDFGGFDTSNSPLAAAYGSVAHHQHRNHHNLNANSVAPTPMAEPSRQHLQALSDIFSPHVAKSSNNSGFSSKPQAKKSHPDDMILKDVTISISGISLEPMPAVAVIDRVQMRTEEVLSKYLPCVDFLVACQQELRKGLAAATTKRLVHHMFRDAMTPRQFYNTYIAHLPEKFYRRNKRKMKTEDLNAAVKELQKLCADARAVERQGCEVVKNTFLGGMKDGESWGLRKWLSKHGGALHICNDCECVLNAVQKLDRSLSTTCKVGERLRPLAKKSSDKLKAEVPPSYQEHSTAHPYLPFFHRLEAALRGMSNFDPEDDDVICIDDDDEVEELKAKVASKPPAGTGSRRKRKHSAAGGTTPAASLGKTAVDESEVEVVDFLSKKKLKPAKKSGTKKAIVTGVDDGDLDDGVFFQALINGLDDDDDKSTSALFNAVMQEEMNLDIPLDERKDAFDLAAALDRLAQTFESNQQSLVRPTNIPNNDFWDGNEQYACVLRLFSDILRVPDAEPFLERVDEETLTRNGKPSYVTVIKHPLCFREVVGALIEESDDSEGVVSGCSGKLSTPGLSSWNLWKGNDLLQAIDLVLVNSLAYGKAVDEGKSSNRSATNKLRKLLWAGIKKVVESRVQDTEARRSVTPTRRGESSGFVVIKSR